MSSVVLCKTLKFFDKVLQTLSESTEQRVFSGFKGDRFQFRAYPRVVRNRVFSENTRYKWQKPQKPGFFDFDAFRIILFVAIENLATDAPYHLLYGGNGADLG
ncbi:hypothetical protein QUB25_12570 [Microcoleus sp. B3-D7]